MGGEGNWALFTIQHDLRQNCADSVGQCIAGEAPWQFRVEVGEHQVRRNVLFHSVGHLLAGRCPRPGCAFLQQGIQRMQRCRQVAQKSGIAVYQAKDAAQLSDVLQSRCMPNRVDLCRHFVHTVFTVFMSAILHLRVHERAFQAVSAEVSVLLALNNSLGVSEVMLVVDPCDNDVVQDATCILDALQKGVHRVLPNSWCRHNAKSEAGESPVCVQDEVLLQLFVHHYL